MGSHDTPVSAYRFKGYVPALLGKVFTPSSEECWCAVGEWILVGGKEEITSIQKEWAQGTYFSLADYIAQTPAADELRDLRKLLFAALMISAVTGTWTFALRTAFWASCIRRA